MTVAENIRRARKSAGLKQSDVANRLGVSPQMISRYESSEKVPKYETLCKIADAIGVDVNMLLGTDQVEKLWNISACGFAEADALKAVLNLLECIYAQVEEKEVCNTTTSYTASIPYYLLKDSFVLYEDDIYTITKAVTALIPALVDSLKDDRSENDIIEDLKSDLSKIKTT